MNPQIIPRLNCSLVHFIMLSHYTFAFVKYLGAKTQLVFIRAMRSHCSPGPIVIPFTLFCT